MPEAPLRLLVRQSSDDYAHEVGEGVTPAYITNMSSRVRRPWADFAWSLIDCRTASTGRIGSPAIKISLAEPSRPFFK